MYTQTVEVNEPKELKKVLADIQKEALKGSIRHSELQRNEEKMMSQPDSVE
jgi:hypothetical protein